MGDSTTQADGAQQRSKRGDQHVRKRKTHETCPPPKPTPAACRASAGSLPNATAKHHPWLPDGPRSRPLLLPHRRPGKTAESKAQRRGRGAGPAQARAACLTSRRRISDLAPPAPRHARAPGVNSPSRVLVPRDGSCCARDGVAQAVRRVSARFSRVALADHLTCAVEQLSTSPPAMVVVNPLTRAAASRKSKMPAAAMEAHSPWCDLRIPARVCAAGGQISFRQVPTRANCQRRKGDKGDRGVLSWQGTEVVGDLGAGLRHGRCARAKIN